MRRSPLQSLYGLYAAMAIVMTMTLVAAPLMVILPRLETRRAAGRFATRMAMWLVGVPLRVKGLSNLPDQACIAVSNHASYVDGVILTAALPERFTFVVQDGAANWPLIGYVIRRMGVSFVNRSSARDGARQTRELLRRVQSGESLTIFAEGTFKSEPGLLPFKRGAFLIASRAGVPLAPVAIRGSRRFFGGALRLPMWHPIEIEILPAIPPSTDAKALSEQARRAIAPACGEPDRSAGPIDRLEAA